MSIGPVASTALFPEPADSQPKVSPAPEPNTSLENSPSAEATPARNVPPVPAYPQDEVHVQQDTPDDYIMIYKFVNQQSGSLILQMPDEQVLSIVHEIQQQLQVAQEQANAALNAPVKLAGE